MDDGGRILCRTKVELWLWGKHKSDSLSLFAAACLKAGLPKKKRKMKEPDAEGSDPI